MHAVPCSGSLPPSGRWKFTGIKKPCGPAVFLLNQQRRIFRSSCDMAEKWCITASALKKFHSLSKYSHYEVFSCFHECKNPTCLPCGFTCEIVLHPFLLHSVFPSGGLKTSRPVLWTAANSFQLGSSEHNRVDFWVPYSGVEHPSLPLPSADAEGAHGPNSESVWWAGWSLLCNVDF